MRQPSGLPRTVGLIGTSLLPLNGMIGAGIFALPAILYAAVGNFAPWMILLGAIFVFPIFAVFARLASLFDHSGGPTLYGEAAFGPYVGFQAGWMRYASALAAFAANAHVAVAYCASFWPVLEQPGVNQLAVAVFILSIMTANLFGMTKAIGTLGIMTLVKLLPLAALVIFALLRGSPHIGFSLPHFSGFQTVVLLTFYAFMGFENVTMPAGEMRRPTRDIPMALLGMLAMVTVFYMLIIWAYIAIDPAGNANVMPLARAAEAVLGRVGQGLIVISAVFSIGANLLTGFVNLSRMTYGMAEQRLLPAWFMKVWERFKTPHVSIVFLGVLTTLFGLTGGFVFLAVAGVLSRLVCYLICAAALPVIRVGAWRRNRISYLADLVMAAFAVLGCLWVASHAKVAAWSVLAAIIGVGTMLYLFSPRNETLRRRMLRRG